MAIGPVQPSFAQPPPPRAAQKRAAEPASTEDRVEIRGARPEPGTYSALRSAPRPDLTALLEESKQQVDRIVRLVGGLVREQGLDWGKVVRGEQHLTIDPATQKAAQDAIADDGVFGVQQTADRILDFARAAAGDDPKKLAQLRDAIEQGFAEAEEAFGGSLPEICYRTMDAVRSELDRWAKAG